jgi:hypothetical protein
MAENFDPNVPGQIQGDVTGLTVIDPAATFLGELGNLVVDPNRDFQVKVDWEVFEQFAPVFLQALAGSWDVRVYAESVGPGDEVEIGQASVPTTAAGTCSVHGGPPCSAFSATVSIPAGTLQEDSPGQSGVYKLVATVFLNSPISGPFDMSGYREGPVIRVETPD